MILAGVNSLNKDMAILSKLLKKGIRLRDSLEQEYASPMDLQKEQLKKLLLKAADTEIGKKYQFKSILGNLRGSSEDFYTCFAQEIPIYDYNSLREEFWHKLEDGKKNVTWPGKVNYFALSSGTSGAASKFIPVTDDMIKAIRKTGVRQMLSLSKYDLHTSLFSKGILMLGGSTDLKFNGTYFSGDLSGITTSKLPIWFQRFYKPGKKIARNRNWGEKLDQIVEKAPDWDIGIIVGVPAWLQLLLEKIIERYKLKTIHDIWPNLRLFVHGGVSFEPYKLGFERLLGHPITYIETYLASEGFLAYQALPDRKSMRLVLNNGIYYEFIPFNSENFDAEGNLWAGTDGAGVFKFYNNKFVFYNNFKNFISLSTKFYFLADFIKGNKVNRIQYISTCLSSLSFRESVDSYAFFQSSPLCKF